MPNFFCWRYYKLEKKKVFVKFCKKNMKRQYYYIIFIKKKLFTFFLIFKLFSRKSSFFLKIIYIIVIIYYYKIKTTKIKTKKPKITKLAQFSVKKYDNHNWCDIF